MFYDVTKIICSVLWIHVTVYFYIFPFNDPRHRHDQHSGVMRMVPLPPPSMKNYRENLYLTVLNGNWIYKLINVSKVIW